MPKFFQTKEFQALNREWKVKLAKDGFHDIENEREALVQKHDSRTVSFRNRTKIRDFYLKLDHYLTNTPGVPDKHRQVLALYAVGTFIKGKKGIVAQTGLTHKQVRNIVDKYKAILLHTRDQDE